MDGNRLIYSTEPVKANMWLLNSGIQNDNGNMRGGFNSWYDMSLENYSYVYSEITGYGITTLLYLSEYFGQEFYVEKAIAAYKWLKDMAMDVSGGVRTRNYLIDMEGAEHYSFNSSNIYAFDNGMVLYGIINLYKKTKKEKVLEFAVQIADFLLENMRKDDGSFFAVYNSKTNEKTDVTNKWSTQSGSYHAKLALGFCDLYEVTGNKKYKEAAESVCGYAINFQEENGRFITNRADNSTHLHPHSYSAEGLLYTGGKLGIEDFIDAAEKAVKWSLSLINDEGWIPKKFEDGKYVPYTRSDILAQTLRLASAMYSQGRISEDELGAMKRLRKRLVSFQNISENKQDGGFYYGYSLDGVKKDHLNSWCTMFALQSLIMYDENVVKNMKKRMECFI